MAAGVETSWCDATNTEGSGAQKLLQSGVLMQASKTRKGVTSSLFPNPTRTPARYSNSPPAKTFLRPKPSSQIEMVSRVSIRLNTPVASDQWLRREIHPAFQTLIRLPVQLELMVAPPRSRARMEILRVLS